MQALVNAGGKGSCMGKCGIEKPMQMVGDKHTVQRVVEALSASSHIDRLLVSVSDNTPETERFLNSIGVETIIDSQEAVLRQTERLRTAGYTIAGEPRTSGDGYLYVSTRRTSH